MARYVLGQKVPDEFNTVLKVKEQQRKLGVKADGVWRPETRAAYQASLKAKQYVRNGQYEKIPGLDKPHFSDVNTTYISPIRTRANAVRDTKPYTENRVVSRVKQASYDVKPATTGAQQKNQAANSKNHSTLQQDFENYLYATKPKTKEEVAELIRDNAQYIKEAAEAYGVDPRIIAGVIYAEQVNNVNYEDVFGDRIGFYGLLDTSIGLGQVKISTAKLVEDMGYIPKTSATEGGWELPVIGHVHGTETMAREKRLENNQMNIMYVAAYLRYWQDRWKDVYPQISNDPAILGTLYNLGVNANAPNKNPQSTAFGDYVKENYTYLGELLGLDS